MRFVIYGAGAVGGVVGARLFESGHDVVLIARGAHHDAIAARGLSIRSATATATHRIAVAPSAQGLKLSAGDVVLLAVKSQHTAAALEDLRAAGADVVDDVGVAVACLQNGVANERVALRSFARVYGVVVMCPTTHLEPGVVEACSAPVTGILDVGRIAGPSARADDGAHLIASAFERSTFVSTVRTDVMRWKWRKLVMNLGNAVQALCAPGDDATELIARARAEGELVMQCAGIDVVSDVDDKARRGALITVMPVDGRARAGGSTWQSIARGTGSIETDYFNGEIVLLGRMNRRPTPVNALLQRLGADASRRRLPVASLSARDLLAQLPTQPDA